MDERRPSSPRPRILFLISHLALIERPSQLAVQVASVVAEYAEQAEVEIEDCAVKDLLAFAEEAERTERADIFVCTGATGAFLRRRLNSAVVLMRTGGNDILYALAQARTPLSSVAVVQYERPLLELEYIRRLWGADIFQGTYTSLTEARTLVAQLASQGYGAIIGSSMVTEIAQEHGLIGILSVSPIAIKRALDDALATIHTRRVEAERKIWLGATLRHLSHGVIAIDAQGIVQAINPALAKVLDVPIAAAVGQHIDRIAPQFGLTRLLSRGSEHQTQVLHLGRNTVLVNMYPMQEKGELVGAVMVCQDANSVQGADRELRINSKRVEHRARYRFELIIGDSPAVRTQLDLARRYARTDSTVLIHGESGTGKELFAQGIHNASARASGPFVAINCASLPEALLESELFGYEEGAFTGARKGGKPGLFEQAHTGTIFLDEIGDMPIALQTRLLRVLQEREVVRLGGTQPTPVNVRVLAATHRRLRGRIVTGEFREDLYYRLNILQLRLPPLRDRKEDLQPLALQIMAGIALRDGLQFDQSRIVRSLLPALKKHHWPGNIRELENVLERAALILADDATALSEQELQDILFDADEGGAAWGQRPAVAPCEPDDLQAAIARFGGSVTLAAKALGMSRTTLWRRLKTAGQSQPLTTKAAKE
ncbi:MAG TPA: sigma 54-interacting transcriptional regulator [Thauera sp.]|nr:sigma 54-interacting transcriptional regulator [Thauera sp.]HNS93977.1 sigma 54-interacting transcriptional regulator [Thauera sp.]